MINRINANERIAAGIVNNRLNGNILYKNRQYGDLYEHYMPQFL